MSRKILGLIVCLCLIHLSTAGIFSSIESTAAKRMLSLESSGAPSLIQVPLTGNSTSYLYSLQAKIGTPGVVLSLLPDTTGSYPLFADKAGECSGDGCSGIKVKYSAQDSSTSQIAGSFGIASIANWTITSATGNVDEDVITIGTNKFSNLTLYVMEKYIIVNPDWNYDGTIGLDWRHSFVTDLIDQNLLLNKSFSLYLKKNPQSSGSFLLLGGIDSKYAASSWTYYPVMGGGWMWAFDSASFGNIPYVGDKYAAIATPTAFTLVNNNYYLAIRAIAPLTVPCSTISKYPNFIIKNGQSTLTFGPSYYYLPDVLGSTCTLGFKPWTNSRSLTLIVLGTNFLRAYYTHYDIGNNQIGFATAATTAEKFLEI